ncbi:MAG TPA: vitamin K epoxide reductase family protein [Candidatus Angelobacter sp.]|nr:vitamin K epoxide reductase family protein [Candidatus Angelobacter sp.]
MRWLIILLALIGLVAAAAALHEHYNTGTSPCSINDRWDCGVVNHSDYAVIKGVPVAVIGIAGYVLLGALAFRKAWQALTAAAIPGLAFSLYLAYIEAKVLETWCIYCVISLTMISSIAIASVVALLVSGKKKQTAIP